MAFSSLLFGCALGPLIAGYLADHFGRRVPLMWVAVLFAFTSLGSGMAPDFRLFLIIRFLGGLAVGGASILAPMYVAEVSPPDIRGRMCACYQWAITTGILISFLLNYLLRDAGPWTWFNITIHDLGVWNWRWMFISGVAPSVVFYLLLLTAPETPRYLCKSGKETEAYAVLEKIVGKDEAGREISEIRTSLTAPKAFWSEITKPGLRKPLIVGFFLAILVHFSGISTIIDYSPIIFKSAGFKIDAALFSTFGIGICNFLFTIVSLYVIDRYGRKRLYITGSIGMTIVLVLLAVSVMAGKFSGMLVLVLIMSYIAFFASCIGPVFWTLVPEIFPNRVRGEAMTVPVLVQWIANAVVVLFFPSVFHKIGKDITFLILAVMCLVQAVFTIYFVPETKNKSLEEIEDLWN